jgi:hypothetical protein
MVAKPLLLSAAILLSVPAASLAQSQSGDNFGVPHGGAAISRSNGGYIHSRHRDNSDQNARSSGGSGREIDARDAGAAFPVTRQASTPK